MACLSSFTARVKALSVTAIPPQTRWKRHIHRAGVNLMAADLAAAGNYRLGQTGRFLCRLDPVFIGLCIDKPQRVRRHHLFVEPFVFAVVEKIIES
jgi:hypothetical protein